MSRIKNFASWVKERWDSTEQETRWKIIAGVLLALITLAIIF